MGYSVEQTTVNTDMLAVARVQSMLRKFAVTVAGANLRLTIHEYTYEQPHGRPPAWSDASNIYLMHVPDVNGLITSVDSLVRLKGLTIHELGHVLFTPRDRSNLVKKVQSENIWQAFNILEDNRIDNMMVARLSGVAPWLFHTVLKEFFGADSSDHSNLLPLVHGRKYIPQRIRDLSAQAYVNQEAVPDIQRVIDKYITLNMSRLPEQKQALDLVRELHNLLDDGDKSQHPQKYAVSPSKNGGEDMAGIREQQDALDRSAKQQTGKSAPDKQETGDGTTAKDKLKEEIAQASTQAEDDMYEDIKSMVRTTRGGSDGTGSGNPEDRRVTPAKAVTMRDVEPSIVPVSRSFARALTELKSLFDPAWVSRESEGRLNARDFLMGSNLDESFDLWDDGKSDASDIECVVMLDISGSMGGCISQAYDSMWAIKRSLDTIAASTTVVTFGDYSRVLYEANSRATMRRKHSWDGSGGTQPVAGLNYSRNVLLNSSRAIKLFIIITDGQWGSKRECDMLITEMRSAGVLTGLVFITDKYTEDRANDGGVIIDGHSCEVVKIVKDPHDITDFARQLVHTQQQNLINS